MTFYRTFLNSALGLLLCFGFQTLGLANEAKTKKSDNTVAQAELKKRVDELQGAMVNLGETLTHQASDSTLNIKTDVQKQLEELGRQLNEVRQRISNHAGESQDAIRKDLGSLLKELGDTLNAASSSVAPAADANGGTRTPTTKK